MLMESDEIQFTCTKRNQQKLVYRGRCFPLKRTNRNDKCWICASGMRGFPGKLYTNLDANKQQLNELKRLAARDPWPVAEIYDELASNASTSLDIAAYFSSWDQARNTMYYSRAKRYPRLPSRRQDLRLTAEQTTTKSGAQFLMYHLPTNDILIFATEAGVRLLAQSNCWCGNGTFKIAPSWYQQLFTLHVFMTVSTYSRIFEVLHSKAEELGVQLDPAKFVCDFETALIPAIQGNFRNTGVQGCFSFTFAKLCFSSISASKPCTRGFRNLKCWDVGSSGSTIRFLRLIVDEHGKTETVVRKMDDDITLGRGSIRPNAAYGVQQRRLRVDCIVMKFV
ncbi:hypothetical protein T11_17707 [Trichinella zimbabwensis]|uniref:MULE transposase domain-containing protein n=1 Tax=Trichinella zimbabwensis TaxID=268475 RepID=A0A0V1GR79_9BILA|nr:hypothetical protein T11_17707 [Trichinella zimbabwensis]